MENFATTIGNILLAHARVKAIDRTAISDTRKAERSRQMSELRRAANALLKTQYTSLSDAAKRNAEDLEAATIELNRALAGIVRAIAVLDAVGAAIGAITNLVGLVRGV
jgi:hypothetical protein